MRTWARPAETECTKTAAAHARTKSTSFAQDFEISQVSRNILDMTCPRMRKPRIVQTHGKTHSYVKLTKWEQGLKKRNLTPPKKNEITRDTINLRLFIFK